MGSVTGTYEHSIDAKGRLFIPAKLREELGDTFYLAMGVDTCLAIYPQMCIRDSHPADAQVQGCGHVDAGEQGEKPASGRGAAGWNDAPSR